jgi:aromatic amino acid aminotransferase I / 2-aminoadipate transaminase
VYPTTDPYYFLQYDLDDIDPNVPGFARHYASAFLPSFLSMDVDGRVLRVDSFSKILAPGMRLGWITASRAFTERLVVFTDASTMHPHGFGQLFTLELLGPNGWGQDGLARWLRSLCADYRKRRDLFLETFKRLVPAELARANTPQAGMFFWIEVNLNRHSRFNVTNELKGTSLARTNTSQLMEELFHFLVDAGVVLMPASIFSISNNCNFPDQEEQRLNFFRATFAGTEQTVELGLTTFAQGLKDFFA